ncbi:MAG: PadR family transcriptional regulator [Lachnospiraceae bacterium]|nr:PadR family transcriptional regulator [Lachnospiraceae bacterium]
MAIEKRIDYVILGLLRRESLTGYEIKKRLDAASFFFWKASYGSIYPALNGLVLSGYAKSKNVNGDKRDKISYTITQKGRSHLVEWLHQMDAKDEMRFETLLKLSFGSEIGAPATCEQLGHFAERIERNLPLLVQQLGTLKQQQKVDTDVLYELQSLQLGVELHKLYLKWCNETIDVLTRSYEGDL